MLENIKEVANLIVTQEDDEQAVCQQLTNQVALVFKVMNEGDEFEQVKKTIGPNLPSPIIKIFQYVTFKPYQA